MQQFTLSGAHIKLFINNKVYPVVQSITFTIDYGETPIYGIDTAYAQELAPSRIDVKGSVQGLRLKNTGGLQGSNIRPLFTDFAASSYISIRIQDRQSTEDILFIQNAKVSRESHSIGAKGTYKLNFDFIGQIPLMALDRSDK